MACNSLNKIFCGSICTQQNQKAMLVKYGKSYIRLSHFVNNNKYTDPYLNYKIPGQSITNLPKLKKPPILYQENFGQHKWHNEKPQTQQYSKGIINQYKDESNEVEPSASKPSFSGTSTRNLGPMMYRKIHNHHTSYGLSRIKSLKNMSLQSVKKTAKGMTHQFSAPSKDSNFSFNTQDLYKADSPELTRFKTIRSVKYVPIDKDRKNLRKKLSESATANTSRDSYIGKKFFHKELKPQAMHLLDFQISDKKNNKIKQTGLKKFKNYEMPQASQTKLSPIKLGQNAEKHALQRYLPNPLDIPFMNTTQVQLRNFSSVKTRPCAFKLKRDGITEDINQMQIRHQMAHAAFVVSNPNDYERPPRKNYSHR